MTTATTRSRTRKARATATALMPRGQHLIDQGADMLILSGRMACIPEPVFWAENELTVRASLPARDRDGYGWDIDENYERALPDYGKLPAEDGPWQYYRASTAVTYPHPWMCPDCHSWFGEPDEPHEPCCIPVVTLTVTQDLPAGAPLPLGELSKEAQAHFDAVFSDPDEEGAQWRPADVPGPVEGNPPTSRAGHPHDGPALDEARDA